MKLSAAIFDLNGTVISDEDEWGEAFRKVLKNLGVNENSEYPHIGGIGIEENWPIFIKKYKIKTDKNIHELASETKREYKKLISRIELKDGFEDFIEELRESGVMTALATSSTWDGIEKILDEFDLEKYFDHITTGEEVKRKKPDPEIFTTTADKMNLDPEECLVFEDSVAGVNAAISAGMRVVGIYRNREIRSQLKEAEADVLVENFEELSPEILEKL